MKSMKILLLYFSFIPSLLWASSAKDWAQIVAPTKNTVSQSIGKYDGGCISGAVDLPLNGAGYQVMRLSRHRYFGHPDLIGFIENLGRAVSENKLGVMLVGDLGQARGGPSLSGHRSHQTGLDVDIWFLLSKEATTHKLSDAERESWGASSMLVAGSEVINDREFTPAQAQMLELAANMPEVDRIFVNPSIKRALCADKNNLSWLRKIRPWYRHDDHFHVRLKCPDGNSECVSQPPLPTGDGCGSDLAWWFSEEAKKPKKHKPSAPKLPALCENVLRQ